MTTQTYPKRKLSPCATLSVNDAALIARKLQLFTIAVEMKKTGLSDLFIVNAVQTALEFEGALDLLHLWANETDKKERDEIIADIQDTIEACQQMNNAEKTQVKFNDLETIANNIRAFKDSLILVIEQQGGITRLSELTGIPQPSLSRFLNSNSMPRRATVLKIAKALNLDEINMDLVWSK